MEKTETEFNGITQGVIWKQLLVFFFPIVFGTLFQQLYNTVDAIIVGQLLGKHALAAVGGGTSTAINLLIGFFTGLASGCAVIISQYYGAQNKEQVSVAIHNTAAIAFFGGLLISALGFFFCNPILRLIGTPDEIMVLASQYTRIYFAGGFIIVMYNMGSAVFRAFGDSKSPLLFLIAGCFLNIGLDLVFIGLFHWGLPGAAFATLLSQFLSLLLVILKLQKMPEYCRFSFSKFSVKKRMMAKMLTIGIPAGIQSIMYGVSNLTIQAGINSFGSDSAAAWAAYGKLDSLYWTVINAFGISITTFVSQNYGAGQIQRAKRGVLECLALSAFATALIELLFLSLGKYGFMLFTNDPGVIDTGRLMMNSIAPYFFTFVCIEVLSSAVRGTGKVLLPTLFTVFGVCGIRLLWIALLPSQTRTLRAVLTCYPVSWVITSVLFIIYYFFGKVYGLKNESDFSS